MMSSTSPTDTKLKGIKNTIIGGDYAGLFATFSSETGKLVSVPEQLGENRAYLFLLMIVLHLYCTNLYHNKPCTLQLNLRLMLYHI